METKKRIKNKNLINFFNKNSKKIKKAKGFLTRGKKDKNFSSHKPRNKSSQQSSHKPKKKSRRAKLKQHNKEKKEKIKRKEELEKRKEKLKKRKEEIVEQLRIKKKERFKQLFEDEKLKANDSQIEIAALMDKISKLDEDIITQIMKINVQYIEEKRAHADLKLNQLTNRVDAIYDTNSDEQLINDAIRGLYSVIDINHPSITQDLKSLLEYIKDDNNITLRTLIDNIKSIDLNKINGFKIESIEIFLEKISLLEKLLDEIEYAINDILLDSDNYFFTTYQNLLDLFESDEYIKLQQYT